MKKPTLISEIGCNHKGDLSIAKEFISVAKEFCRVPIVKFQKRSVKELLSPEEYAQPHPNPYHAYGETYGKHRDFLEFSLDQHRELKKFCEARGLVYGCSVWDMTSLKEIVSLGAEYLKLPSAANTNLKLLEYACKHHPGLLHVSLGMTTQEEERRIVSFVESRGRLQDLVLYACTSGYPVPAEDAALLEIRRLNEAYGGRVHAIGFSGHHNGISIDIAAYTLGAAYIERHFTLDRTWKGTDHAASLEPDGLRRLNRDLLNIQKALTYKTKELLDIEVAQRRKLKWDRNTEPYDPKQRLPRKEPSLADIKLVLMDVDGVLTDAGMYYSERGDELKKFNTRDGVALGLLRKAGIATGIITGESTGLVKRRAEKIGADIVHLGAEDKLALVKRIMKERRLKKEEICFIGDDLNDLAALSHIGFGAVPADAAAECKDVARYVCRRKGGEGCVREIAELILAKRLGSARETNSRR